MPASFGLVILIFFGGPASLAGPLSSPLLSVNKTRYVELSAFAEWVGATATIAEGRGILTVSLDEHTIEMTMGSKVVIVDGSPTRYQALPVQRGGRFYVPLNFVASKLGVVVSVDSRSQQATIRHRSRGDMIEVPVNRPTKGIALFVLMPPGTEAMKEYREGVRLKRQQDYRAAIPHFQKALTLSPDFPEARLALAWAWLADGEKDKAIGEFRQVLRATPYSKYRKEASQALSRHGKSEEPTEPIYYQPQLFQQQPVDLPAVAGPPLLGSWILRDEFVDSLHGPARRFSVSQYEFYANGTGRFAFTWPGSKDMDVHPLLWHTDKDYLILEFQPVPPDQWIEWPARMKWSVSDDGQRLTLSGDDMRASLLKAGQSIYKGMIEGGLDPGKGGDLISPIEPAIYKRM